METIPLRCCDCSHMITCKPKGKQTCAYCWHPDVRGDGLGLKIMCSLLRHEDCPVSKKRTGMR